MRLRRLMVAIAVVAAAPAFGKEVKSIFEDIGVLRYSLRNGLLPMIVAKEYCSCLFVQKFPLNECKKRDGLPFPALNMLDIDEKLLKQKIVRVKPRLLGKHPWGEARFVGKGVSGQNYGCVITHGPADAI
ncbi:MAG: hypothetical protein AB7P04_15730 [Bacteriovoracia bacterium]